MEAGASGPADSGRSARQMLHRVYGYGCGQDGRLLCVSEQFPDCVESGNHPSERREALTVRVAYTVKIQGRLVPEADEEAAVQFVAAESGRRDGPLTMPESRLPCALVRHCRAFVRVLAAQAQLDDTDAGVLRRLVDRSYDPEDAASIQALVPHEGGEIFTGLWCLVVLQFDQEVAACGDDLQSLSCGCVHRLSTRAHCAKQQRWPVSAGGIIGQPGDAGSRNRADGRGAHPDQPCGRVAVIHDAVVDLGVDVHTVAAGEFELLVSYRQFDGAFENIEEVFADLAPYRRQLDAG